MNAYKNISSELKSYFGSKGIFKILLPLDIVLIFGGLGLMILNLFISIGGFLYPIAYWGFILGLVLAFANFHQQFLYLGLLGYAALQVLDLFVTIFRFKFLSWSSIFEIVIFGGLGYLVFRNSSISTTHDANVQG